MRNTLTSLFPVELIWSFGSAAGQIISDLSANLGIQDAHTSQHTTCNIGMVTNCYWHESDKPSYIQLLTKLLFLHIFQAIN